MSFNSVAAVTVPSDFGAQENKLCHYFHFSPLNLHELMGPDTTIFIFRILSFKPAFSLSSSPSSRGSLVPFHFLPLEWCVLAKSLQSCPTLCDPMDSSPPGSSVHEILQARILELGYLALLQGVFPTQGSNLCLLSPLR